MKRTILIFFLLACFCIPAYAGPSFSGGGGGGGGGNVATDTIFDVAGDLVYGTGADTADRLAIGTAYQVLMTNSGATAPAWTSTLGATGTRLIKGWFTDLEVTNAIAGSVTGNAATATALAANPSDCGANAVATAIDASGNLTCSYSIGTNIQAYDTELAALAGLTSAANAIPYFTGSGTAGVISSSANMVSLLGSADYSTARTNLGLAIGTNVQAYHASLASIAGLTETNGGIPYGTADNTYAWLGAGATGKILIAKGAAAPEWTPYTMPATVPTTGYGLISDGTNMVATSSAFGTAAYTASTAYQAADAELAILAGLTFADASIIQLTASNSAAVLTSGGNNYFLKSTSDNSAIEFATPANALTAIGGQAADATLTSLAGLSITEGDLIIGSGADAVVALDAGTQNYILTMGAARPAWSNTLQIGTLNLPAADADPGTTAGQIVHDTSVSNHAHGAVRWYDGTNIRHVVDMVAATAEGCTDDQVVAYDADNDLFYCKNDATAGSPTMDSIGDATADGEIALGGYEIKFTSTLDEANHSVITISNTDADRANDTTLLTLSDNDAADANAFFVKMIADADGTPVTVFSITGLAAIITPDTTISGDLTVSGSDITLDAAGVKLTGSNGALTILGLGDGQDEDLKIDLNSTANTIEITSPASSATAVDFNTLNLVTTGTISGGSQTPVIGDADVFDDNCTGACLYGGTFIVSAAGTVVLPNATAGMNFTIVLEAAAATVIEPLATGTDDTIVLNGTALTQGHNITSSTQGAMCVFQYRAADSWMATCNGFVDGS